MISRVDDLAALRRLYNVNGLRETGFHLRVVSDSHNLERGIPFLDGLEGVAVGLYTLVVEERRLVNKQESELHSCGAALELRQCKDDREGRLNALTAGTAHVGQGSGRCVVHDDVQRGDLFLAVALEGLFHAHLNAHVAA